MYKKGFTLIEVLAIIALIGVIATIAIPATINILNDGIKDTMKTQENEIKKSAIIFLEDYCKSPIDSTYVCPLNRVFTDGVPYYNGSIELSVLVNNEYIGEVTVRGESCNGTISFTNSEPTVTLDCGELYRTKE